MTKTTRASFAVPDNGEAVRIDLEDTEGVMVGAGLRIGFDHYTIAQVDETGVTALKSTTNIPAGLECWIMDELPVR